MKHLIDYRDYGSVELALQMRYEDDYNPSAIAELLERNGDNYSAYESIQNAYRAALDETLSEVLSEIKDHQLLDSYRIYVKEQNHEDLYPIYYSMDEFDEIVRGYEPHKIATMCFYGDFIPCDDYFYFDAYGHIVSLDERKVIKEIHENLTHDDLWDVIEIAAQLYDTKEWEF